MKRYSIVLTVLVLAAMLTLVCASQSTAVLPKPDGYVGVKLAQGWYANNVTWYIGTATNDIRFAQTGGLTLAPKLTNALANAAPVYIVKNFQQGPVFSAAPGVPGNYSGFWRVYYITWLPGNTPRPIINDTVGDPKGIPAVGVTVVASSVVVDYPILIVGPLSPAPIYKIPQLISYSAYAKTASLPYFNAFCQNFITKKVSTIPCLITDSSNKYVAPIIGANYSPVALGLMPAPAAENAWLFDPTNPMTPSPPGQLPILESCPSAFNYRNSNYDFSPIMKGHLLIRTGASPSSIINNPTTLANLIGLGKITPVGTTTLNVSPINPLQPLR